MTVAKHRHTCPTESYLNRSCPGDDCKRVSAKSLAIIPIIVLHIIDFSSYYYKCSYICGVHLHAMLASTTMVILW